ncbi:MAG: hypothetical protein ACK55Z_27595, partial [bacterium]
MPRRRALASPVNRARGARGGTGRPHCVPRAGLVLRGGCSSSQRVSVGEVAEEAAGDGGPPQWLPVSEEDFEPPDPFARAAADTAGGEDRPLSDEDHLS